jgi:hypothetical protein
VTHIDERERDVLKIILRKHGLAEDITLAARLEEFAVWVKENQQTYLDRRSNAYPKPALVMLAQMGIYGADALDQPPKTGAPPP